MEENMADKTIKITVNNQGNMTIDPSTWKANRHEMINWTCSNGTFTVLFPHTPFDGVEFHGAKRRHRAHMVSMKL